jgi:conjugal transfer pilin signal peptidase TrbI
MIAAQLVSRADAWVRDFRADEARMRFMHRALFWTVVAWFVATVGAGVFRSHYRIGLDLEDVRCMPWVAYIVKLDHEPALTRGAFIAILDGDGVLGPRFKNQLLGKQITGLPGDRVVVKNDFVWVNGKPVGALILHKELGRKPGGFDREEVVPPGKLFLTGLEPRSYDSRYGGFFDPKYIVGSVSPIF